MIFYVHFVFLLCFLAFHSKAEGHGDVPEDGTETNDSYIGKDEFLKELKKIIVNRVKELMQNNTEELFLRLNRKITDFCETDTEVKNLLSQQAPQLFNFDGQLRKVSNRIKESIKATLKNKKMQLINKTEHEIIKFISEMRAYVSSTNTRIQTKVEQRFSNIMTAAGSISVNTRELLDARLNEMIQNISHLKFETEQTVAFSATLSGNAPQNDRVIKFDNVLTNAGNGYSGTQGIFTAPVDGLYTVVCSFLVVNGYVNVKLVRNGNEIGRGYAAQNRHEATGSVFGTLDLKKGDDIYCQKLPGYSTGLVRGDLYSTFSGFMISK